MCHCELNLILLALRVFGGNHMLLVDRYVNVCRKIFIELTQ